MVTGDTAYLSIYSFLWPCSEFLVFFARVYVGRCVSGGGGVEFGFLVAHSLLLFINTSVIDAVFVQ